jgi:beta-galactosidase/beta-glucuronidase
MTDHPQQQKSQYLTKWGRSLSEDSVLDEYPRPQLVRDQWQNLNGKWRYAIAPKRAPQPQHWDGEILVPFCIESALSGVARTFAPSERLWYQRRFNLNDSNQRTLLHFGAVDYECSVWINGGLAGNHTGGFDAFTIDITEYVDTGSNELVVAVTDPTSSGDQPRGKQHLKPQGIWYTPVTGIWQTVWLEQVPFAQHIEELQLDPSVDCDGVTLAAMLYRPSRDPVLAAHFSISLNGRIVAETVGRADRNVYLPIPDPQLWSPEHPTLYDVTATLLRIDNPLPDDNDQQEPAQLLRQVPLRGKTEAAFYAAAAIGSSERLDQVRGYFGLRRIEVGAHPKTAQPTLLLNGEARFHLGTLDQGWWPDGLHTPPADAAMVYEIEYLKAAGFNTVRKHIKIEPARYYYHCDRLGMMVWQDMPSGFLPAQFVAPNDEDEGLRTNRSSAAYGQELERMIRCLRPHPSILIWVLHNEGWGQFDSRALTERIRLLDSSRLINSNSGWRDMGTGDIIDRHDYQPAPTPPEADSIRARVIGEYGGIGWPMEKHLWDPEMRNWGYQTFNDAAASKAAYQQATEAIIAAFRNDGLSAAIYTQTTDVEGEVNGLITYDREVEKFPRQWLAQIHAPLTRSKS